MNIKKLLSYLFVIVLLYSVSLLTISFKNGEITEGKRAGSIHDDDPVYYWYFVRVRIDDRTNTFKLSGTSGGLDYGYLIDFEKNLWNGLSKRQIAVGPFLSREEALNAKRLYKTSADKINEMPEGEIPDRIHWFAITFEQSPRLRIFVIRRAPGAVQTGTVDQFIAAFYEQLNVRLLSIGPFYYYEQAEEAKRLYRVNE
ncbi:MAG: hypothetical protein JXL97_13940 [Bacteroidales bacterium]|nr:hypothetical protein [Bacteroidales bacterium]